MFCAHFRRTGILIYIHVCGNSTPILEMLADTGVHTVEPLDPMGGVSVVSISLSGIAACAWQCCRAP